MSLNSLKIASDGYLKRTSKAVLIIAVAGYLNYSDAPPVDPPIINPPQTHIPSRSSSGSGFGIGDSSQDATKDRLRAKRKREIEDSEIIAIVEVTLKNLII